MTGKITSLNSHGYGFIRAETGQDVFFHKSVLVDACFEYLQQGHQVTFEFEDSPKGVRATVVTVVD